MKSGERERLETVCQALAHRSRNMLATLQSIVMQTAQSSPSTDIFVERIVGRIQAMSQSYDLLAAYDMRGAALSSLLESQAQPFISVDEALSVEGPDCFLTADAALYVGLALHELAVMASDGEALAVAVVSSRSEEGARIVWRHTVTTRDTRDGPDGFQRLLLDRVVPTAVGGAGSLGRSADTVTYSLTIAPSECEWSWPTQSGSP